MQVPRLALLLVLMTTAVYVAQSATMTVKTDFPTFLELVHKFGRKYQSIDEMQKRFQIFLDNAEYVQQLRDTHSTSTGEPGELIYGWTKFFDISREEFKATYLNFKPSERVFQAHKTAQIERPRANINVRASSFNWVNKGAVTPVKDQGQCGSCWAFSATEGVESAWFLAGNNLTELSVQQIVSCDTVDQGCNGGDLPTAFKYIEDAHGLESGKEYPYASGDGNAPACKYNKKDIVANITGFTYATTPCQDACNSQDENTLLTNVASTGPASICVDAEPWQFYTSGIMKSGCPHAYSDLDHCVQLVGYNSGSTPYWIVRNSWNTDWGIEGFIWIEFGHNLCGIADEATFVKI